MADTLDHMIAGFSVIFGVMLIYVVSLFMRFKKLRQEAKYLAEMKDDTP